MPTRQGPSRSIKGTTVTDLLHVAPHNTADDPLYVSGQMATTEPLRIEGAHMISVGNSTTTPLGSNGVFTGAWEEVDTYVSIMVLVNSDHLATTDSIRIDFSTDGVNLDRSISVTFQTGGDYCSFPSEAKFFRLRIFNGNQAQTFLRAQVRYNAVAESNKLVPLGDSVTQSSAALLAKSSIVGRSGSGGGTFVDVKVNPSGALQTEVTGTVAISGTVNIAEPVDTQDDYALGELLNDQIGPGVLVFTFAQPVVSYWVAVVGNPADTGVVKVDHYGGIPAANRGIPIPVNQTLPIPEPTSVVRVFVPDDWTVTVWGQRR